LGWRSKQSKLILRAGPGEGWGFEGYLDLSLAKYSHYVHSYYLVTSGNKAVSSKEASNIQVESD